MPSHGAARTLPGLLDSLAGQTLDTVRGTFEVTRIAADYDEFEAAFDGAAVAA